MQASAAVIGCGALGSLIAESLVRAGIGHLHIVDRDVVDVTNLQRQQLFTEQHAKERTPKVVAAEQRLREIRSDVKLSMYMDHADRILLERLAMQSDLIIDATDNFETRILINDVAHKYKLPWIYGACVGSSGVIFPFIPGSSACLRCLMPVLPAMNETCDTAGIIGAAAQMTAVLQTAEALKWLSGNEGALMRRVHYFDLWLNERMDIGISRIKQANCPTCSEHPSYPALTDYDQMTVMTLCGRNTVQIIPDRGRTISLEDAELAGRRIDAAIRRTPYIAELEVREYRIIVFDGGRLLIHGLDDVHQARKLYHRIFG